MKRPPFVPRLLMRLLLPPRIHELVSGDLEEAWREAPRRRTYWRLALQSIYDCRTTPRLERASRPPGEFHMHATWQDIRYAARAMTRTPGFTAAAVVTLALGIGATTAVLGIINLLALQPLPYHEPSRVAFVLGLDAASGAIRFSMRVADYFDIRRDVRSFRDVSAYTYLSANLTGGDIPERVQAYSVTPNTFDVLGVPAAVGRTFTTSDGAPGATPVVVISDGLWKRRFGADRSILQRSVLLNGQPHQVIGIMPAGFEYPVFNFKGDAWVPWALDPVAAATDRAASGGATIVARLAPGATLAGAEADVQAVLRRLAAEHPETNGTLGGRVIEIGGLDDDQAGAAMTLALGAVGLVLVLACANVANLLLARGVSRSRELAVRAAVGATRWRIARQLLIESLWLACLGAIGGVALAVAALRSLVAVLPEMLLTTVPNITTLGVDRTVLLFSVALAMLVTVLTGLLPAWRAARPALQDGLKEGAAAGGTRETRRLRGALVVAEVALATVLLIGAGLLVRSHGALTRIDPGFSPDGVLTLAMSLPADRYPDAPARLRFFDGLTERLHTTAGVHSAGLVNVLPFSTYDRRTRFVIDGRERPAPGREPAAAFRIASPDYFDTMRIPIAGGRAFARADHAAAAPVAVINQAFARRYFEHDTPIGHRIRLGTADNTSPWLTVIGVVGDVHHSELTGTPDPEVYVPLAQASATGMMMLAVRTEGDPEGLIATVRSEVLRVDPLQPVYHVKPLARMVNDSLLAATTSAWLMGIFSGVALVLAVVGIFGVVSYTVTQQMPEYGVRLALGATPARLAGLVIRQGTVLVTTGILIGTLAAYALSAGLRSLVFGITATDPATYATAVATLAVLGCAACVVPAMRAASTGPLTALRRE
jgi:putative ABC transport system permease protein